MFRINSLGGYELHFCCTVLSLLFQKSLSRSLQRPETRGARKGKYKREKLNSCERGGKAAPAPGAAGTLRRERERRGVWPPAPRTRHTHGHTHTGGRTEQGRAVERPERAAPMAAGERRMVGG